MKRRLPSLLAIRYFEAVGRNLSFTLAANELNVTQAAVSHQVRLLEDELGTKLVTRLHQRIELTKHGIQLLDVATECLDKLSDAVDGISGRARSERIHLSVTPLLSARWLMPSLGEFLGKERNIEILLHHSLNPPNVRETFFDLKLFFSPTPLQDPAYEFLFQDTLVPICVPALWPASEGLSAEEFLRGVGIVHEFDYEWWSVWCTRNKIDKHVVQRGIVLDDPAVLENAMLVGRGVALGSLTFLSERLASGELITPFGRDGGIEINYYVYSGVEHKRDVIERFRSWLRLKSAEQREKFGA